MCLSVIDVLEGCTYYLNFLAMLIICCCVSYAGLSVHGHLQDRLCRKCHADRVRLLHVFDFLIVIFIIFLLCIIFIEIKYLHSLFCFF
jgi:hypothetical protein